MDNSHKKVKIMSVAAVIAGAVMYLVPDYFISPVLDRYSIPYCVSEIMKVVLAYAVVFLFGFLCYGKDKRIFRVVFGFALGNQLGMLLFYPVFEIISDLISTLVYIDSVYVAYASFFSGIAVSLLAVLKFNSWDELLFICEAEGEARLKNWQPEKAIALICGVTVIAERTIGYLFAAIFTPLTFELEEELTYLGGHIGGLLATVAVLALCVCLCRLFVREKKAILYCMSLFCFVYSIFVVIPMCINDIIIHFVDVNSIPLIAVYVICRLIPFVIGVGIAVALSVIIARCLTDSKKN